MGTTEKKAASSARNGLKGGRPREYILIKVFVSEPHHAPSVVFADVQAALAGAPVKYRSEMVQTQREKKNKKLGRPT